MQEKKQYISPIKQRILYFADTLNISKREFYKKISVSRGTLESSTGITEDIMAKFIATYPEVSPEWLVTGRGPMIRPPTDNYFQKESSNLAAEQLPSYIKKRRKDEPFNILEEVKAYFVERENLLLSIINNQQQVIDKQNDMLKFRFIQEESSDKKDTPIK